MFFIQVTEGPARGGEEDFMDFGRLGRPGQALENRAVFAIDRKDFGAGFLRRPGHHFPGHDHGFLVGQGDILTLLDGR